MAVAIISAIDLYFLAGSDGRRGASVRRTEPLKGKSFWAAAGEEVAGAISAAEGRATITRSDIEDGLVIKKMKNEKWKMKYSSYLIHFILVQSSCFFVKEEVEEGE